MRISDWSSDVCSSDLTPELTRAGLLDCLRKRHHYGTTGNRMILDVRAAFDAPGMVYHDDPALGPANGAAAEAAMMGDIVHLPSGEDALRIDLHTSAQLARVDIVNGREHLQPSLPNEMDARGNRITTSSEDQGNSPRHPQVT